MVKHEYKEIKVTKNKIKKDDYIAIFVIGNRNWLENLWTKFVLLKCP